MEGEYNHPCKGTCSGWYQGYEAGKVQSKSQMRRQFHNQLAEKKAEIHALKKELAVMRKEHGEDVAEFRRIEAKKDEEINRLINVVSEWQNKAIKRFEKIEKARDYLRKIAVREYPMADKALKEIEEI